MVEMKVNLELEEKSYIFVYALVEPDSDRETKVTSLPPQCGQGMSGSVSPWWCEEEAERTWPPIWFLARLDGIRREEEQEGSRDGCW